MILERGRRPSSIPFLALIASNGTFPQPSNPISRIKRIILKCSYLYTSPIQINPDPLPSHHDQEQDHRGSLCGPSISPSLPRTPSLRTNPGTRKRKDTRPQTRDLIYPTVTLAGFNLSLDLAARLARSLHSRTRLIPAEKGRERKAVVWFGVQRDRVDRRWLYVLVARCHRFIVIALSHAVGASFHRREPGHCSR